MSSLLQGFIVCFSMYTVIPMPNIPWDKKSMQYAFCFFPLIGGLITLLQWGWGHLLSGTQYHAGVYVCIAAVLPVLLTGGIHLDGWIDTCDAIFSHGDREKRLQVLQDPQTGAFGVIYTIVYVLVTLAGYSFLGSLEPERFRMFLVFPFLLSRSVGGLMVVSLKKAKDSGLIYLFSDQSSRRVVQVVLTLWTAGVLFYAYTVHYRLLLVLVAIVFSVVAVLTRYFYKEFGGISGDLVGFSISMLEGVLLLLPALLEFFLPRIYQ